MALTVNHPMLKEVWIQGTIPDGAAANALVCFTSPVRGKIVECRVTNSAVVDSDRVYTFYIGTGGSPTAITGGAVTCVASGSVIGGSTSVTPTAANSVVEGDTIQAITDGAGSTATISICAVRIQLA